MTVTLADIVKALQPHLDAVGCRVRAGGIVTCDVSEGFVGTVGLNSASRRERAQLEVNPVIGLRHQPTEDSVARLLRKRRPDPHQPTISQPLGYLMPERRYTAWFFDADHCETQAHDLARAVRDHGLPFMRANADLQAIRDRIQEGLGHNLHYRLPVVLAHLGDRQGAHDVVRRELAEQSGRHDLASEEYRRFAAALLDEWP